MLDFKPTEDIISLSEFRNTLADCVARTAETHRPIILTQNGRATSVFLSAADWEKISQKIYDAEIYEDILVSEGESERGEVYTNDEVTRIIEADLKKLAKAARPSTSAHRRIARWPDERHSSLDQARHSAPPQRGSLHRHQLLPRIRRCLRE